MVRFQRTTKVKRGKESTKWAKELVDYTNTVFGQPVVQLFRARFGNVDTMYWVADFDSLATLEEWQKKLGADPGYRALTKKASDIVIDGTIGDTILESL